MMGPTSPSNTGDNGNPNRGIITPSKRITRRPGRGGGRGRGRGYSNWGPYLGIIIFHLPSTPHHQCNLRRTPIHGIVPRWFPFYRKREGKTPRPFFVNDGDLEATREIKLTAEFPTNSQQDSTNGISMYFKRFATVILALHSSVSILNWDNPTQNPVTKAVDISPNEGSIKQYFSGMVV